MELTILASLIVLCMLGLSWFAGSGAPYIPTKYPKLKELFKAAGLKPGDDFYELGSGDGRVVLVAAQMGAESYGIEESWLRVWWSRWKAYRQKLPNAHFFHGSIFTRHYFSAEVVYIYMLPATVDRLEPILKEELKPGAKVITQRYHFKNWMPSQEMDDFRIYIKA